MTLEELKTEAKKYGYKLVKDTPYIRLAHCVCGHKSISSWTTFGEKTPTPYSHQCRKCGFASEPARTKYEAKLKWNECVERVKALEYITADIDTLIDTRKE